MTAIVWTSIFILIASGFDFFTDTYMRFAGVCIQPFHRYKYPFCRHLYSTLSRIQISVLQASVFELFHGSISLY